MRLKKEIKEFGYFTLGEPYYHDDLYGIPTTG